MPACMHLDSETSSSGTKTVDFSECCWLGESLDLTGAPSPSTESNNRDNSQSCHRHRHRIAAADWCLAARRVGEDGALPDGIVLQASPTSRRRAAAPAAARARVGHGRPCGLLRPATPAFVIIITDCRSSSGEEGGEGQMLGCLGRGTDCTDRWLAWLTRRVHRRRPRAAARRRNCWPSGRWRRRRMRCVLAVAGRSIDGSIN